MGLYPKNKNGKKLEEFIIYNYTVGAPDRDAIRAEEEK